MDAQINAVINNIAEKLGVAVGTISDQLREIMKVTYPVFVRQVYGQALARGIGFLVSLALTMFLFICYKDAAKVGEIKNDEFSMWALFIFACSIIATLFFVAALQRIVNPDWYAINLMVREISGIIH